MAEKKNVLLISYYWPPSGGAGVHRWLRFSRYFQENNVNLTVYCPENAAWPAIDEELLNEVPAEVKVIRKKIFEPHKFLAKKGNAGVGFTQNKKPSRLQQLIVWVRGNLFIPDSRVFWIKPSVRFLSNYLKEHPEIDIIISTGPPHSMHIIANSLKKKFNLKWMADFRDPWTQIDFYQDLLPGKRADKKHRKLERECLTNADEVITVSDSCADGLAEIVPRKIHTITNGFIFPSFNPKSIELDEKFTISHFGSMSMPRNPLPLWKALSEILQENHRMKECLSVKLIGTVDYKVVESAKEYGVDAFLEIIPPVSHKESILLQQKSQILLLVANNAGNVKGILTGKIFEYFGAKRPIICIGQQDSDLEKLTKETDAGCFSDYDSYLELKDFLVSSFEKYAEKNLFHEAKNIEPYSSQVLVKKIVDLM